MWTQQPVEGSLNLWPLDVTTLPNRARSMPHRYGRLRCAVPLDKTCQDNSEVIESLLPSCCLVRGTRREANVVLFLGKSLITGGITGCVVLLVLQNSSFPVVFVFKTEFLTRHNMEYDQNCIQYLVTALLFKLNYSK